MKSLVPFCRRVSGFVATAVEKVKGAAFAVAAAFGLAVAAAPPSAHAALTLDSTAILADVATVVTFVTAVGLAVLGLMYIIKAIKWARGGA